MSDDKTAFERKVESVAMVLSDIPYGQVLSALELMAESDDYNVKKYHITTLAGNIATDEELREEIRTGEIEE